MTTKASNAIYTQGFVCNHGCICIVWGCICVIVGENNLFGHFLTLYVLFETYSVKMCIKQNQLGQSWELGWNQFSLSNVSDLVKEILKKNTKSSNVCTSGVEHYITRHYSQHSLHVSRILFCLDVVLFFNYSTKETSSNGRCTKQFISMKEKLSQVDNFCSNEKSTTVGYLGDTVVVYSENFDLKIHLSFSWNIFVYRWLASILQAFDFQELWNEVQVVNLTFRKTQ